MLNVRLVGCLVNVPELYPGFQFGKRHADQSVLIKVARGVITCTCEAQALELAL